MHLWNSGYVPRCPVFARPDDISLLLPDASLTTIRSPPTAYAGFQPSCIGGNAFGSLPKDCALALKFSAPNYTYVFSDCLNVSWYGYGADDAGQYGINSSWTLYPGIDAQNFSMMAFDPGPSDWWGDVARREATDKSTTATATASRFSSIGDGLS